MNNTLKTHPAPGHNLLVFTDLDGSLLDHFSYSFAAATEALSRLAALDTPLILNSSKTLAELQQYSRRLNIRHPVITENGGAICVPVNYFPHLRQLPRVSGYQVQFLSPPYPSITKILQDLRKVHAYKFRGFNDMTDWEVAELTGLKLQDAALARRRTCSEPLLWQDSEEKLEQFREDLMSMELRLTRGGRFFHVIGMTNKRYALEALIAHYRIALQREPVSIGLGDSDNDLEMLSRVDYPVVIRRHDGSHLQNDKLKNAIHTQAIGPEGWNQAVLELLNRIMD